MRVPWLLVAVCVLALTPAAAPGSPRAEECIASAKPSVTAPRSSGQDCAISSRRMSSSERVIDHPG